MSGEHLPSLNSDNFSSSHQRHSQHQHDTAHYHGESQFSSTSTTDRHHPSHLILNNFLDSSQKSISIAHPPDHLPRNSCNETSNCKNEHSNFLYVYFLFSYYLCLTPFRLKKVVKPAQSDNPSFEIHEYVPQKVICAISNILALLRYAVELRRCIQEVKRDNPISFFKLFEACSGFLFKTVIMKCFWRNKKSFLHIVRFLDSPYILPYNKFKIESAITISAVCGIYVLIGFARMIAGSGFVRSPSLNFSWWSRRLVAEARYSVFLSNESHIDSAPSTNDIGSFDIFLAVITGFTFQCRYIAGYFVDVGILLCVLSLWAPVAGFTNNLRRQLENKIQMKEEMEESKSSPPLSHQVQQAQEKVNCQEVVMKQYKALKRLTELISQANGETILPFISEAVFGYAIFFEDVLITTNHFHRVVLICFYFCAVNILIFSADVCRKMQCMKTWLWDEERFSTFPTQKLMVVLHDLSTNSVGINASGIFTVDFYLVGSMISVLITLFIIRLQYQTTEV